MKTTIRKRRIYKKPKTINEQISDFENEGNNPLLIYRLISNKSWYKYILSFQKKASR
jgi:hypothetical protein